MCSREICECDRCGSKTNELYLTKYSEILCADCEADFITGEIDEDGELA